MPRLDVRVIECRNLPEEGLLGPPSPYVVLELANNPHLKTSTAHSTTNPKYDEVFKFRLADPETEQLELKIWHSGNVSDHFLGSYKLGLDGLTRGVGKDDWYLLHQCKTQGEIRLNVVALDFGKESTEAEAESFDPSSPQKIKTAGSTEDLPGEMEIHRYASDNGGHRVNEGENDTTARVHFQPRFSKNNNDDDDDDNDEKNKNDDDDDKESNEKEEEQDSMIVLLGRVRAKADKDKVEADKHPQTVEEAEELQKTLEKKKEAQKKHLLMLADIAVSDANRDEYKKAADSIESAYISTKQGIDRSKTVVQMSRFVLPARETKKLQICFCFDATASLHMGNIINVLKDTMIDIARKIQDLSALPVEFGFCCYRDYDDRHPREACNFTSNIEKVVDKLSKIKAEGGGDDAEDCLGALNDVIHRMKWKPMDNSIRVCCWCGDAPGHGLIGPSRPGTFTDEYPEGDKNGLTVHQIVSDLVKHNIVLAFLRINSLTDYMIELFKLEMMNVGATTYDLPVADLTDVSNTQAMINQLLVQCSAVSTTTRHRHPPAAGSEEEKDDPSRVGEPCHTSVFAKGPCFKSLLPPRREPRPASPPERAALEGNLFAVTPIQFNHDGYTAAKSDIRAFIKAVVEAKHINELPPARSVMKSKAVLHVEVPYFSTGGNKYAHLAHLASTVNQEYQTRVIAKDFVDRSGNNQNKLIQKHLMDLKAITIAQTLASLFCEKLHIPPSTLEFIHRSIFVTKDGGGSVSVETDDEDIERKKKHNEEERIKNPSLSTVYSIEPLLPVLVDESFAPSIDFSPASTPSKTGARQAEMSKMTSYNSNGGFQDAHFDLIQAFSHFTWHITDGKLMVLDLKGCHEEREKRFFRLLVPAIQTKEYSMFPSITNIGEEAMIDFLKVHRCGDMCKACGIPSLNGGYIVNGATRGGDYHHHPPNMHIATGGGTGGGGAAARFGSSGGGDGGVNVLVGPPMGYTGGGVGSVPTPLPGVGYFGGVGSDDGSSPGGSPFSPPPPMNNNNNNFGFVPNMAVANGAFNPADIPMAIPFTPGHYTNTGNTAAPSSFLPFVAGLGYNNNNNNNNNNNSDAGDVPK